jgi:CubicO group peptidase (beta-lactamase class C family)
MNATVLRRTLLIRYSLFVVLLALHGVTIQAQTLTPELSSRFLRALDSTLNILKAKSLSAAVHFPDGTIWSRARGMSSAFDSVRTTDLYLIGSITKTLTSACILQLSQEKKLNLDDTIGKWIEPVEYVNPAITIRQLLRHQSGLYDILQNPECTQALMNNRQMIFEVEDLITGFIKPPLSGVTVNSVYSNTNYFLLGMIIKKVTGNPFYVEYRKRFFTPSNLNTFVIPAYETMTARVAHVWIDLNGDGVVDDANDFYQNYRALNSAAGAAGGYYATSADISRWIWLYVRGSILDSSHMAQAKTFVPATGLGGYGLGLMRRTFSGYTAIGHQGDLSYAGSAWYFPALDISITVSVNDSRNNSWSLTPTVVALLNAYTASVVTGVETDDDTQKLSDDSPNSRLQIFPNPIYDYLSIDLRNLTTLESDELVISNTLGEVVLRQRIDKGSTSVLVHNLEDLPKGMYVVSIKSVGKILSSSAMIKH